MAGDKVLDWCRTEPIPKGLKDSARGQIPIKKDDPPSQGASFSSSSSSSNPAGAE
jgi:hypothetical protein